MHLLEIFLVALQIARQQLLLAQDAQHEKPDRGQTCEKNPNGAEQQGATNEHQTSPKIHGVANKAVDARVNDMLAALGLNTHQLRQIRVIGERAEERETAPEEQEASAYFAPQR